MGTNIAQIGFYNSQHLPALLNRLYRHPICQTIVLGDGVRFQQANTVKKWFCAQNGTSRVPFTNMVYSVWRWKHMAISFKNKHLCHASRMLLFRRLQEIILGFLQQLKMCIWFSMRCSKVKHHSDVDDNLWSREQEQQEVQQADKSCYMLCRDISFPLN